MRRRALAASRAAVLVVATLVAATVVAPVAAQEGPSGADALLLDAAYAGTAAEVRALLEAGADPNAADAAGGTALMQAAAANAPEVVELLVAAGADVDARSDEGLTALAYALRDNPDPAAVRGLLELGAEATGFSYATFVDPELGFRVDYPDDLVAPAEGAPEGGRRAFLPEDERFRMAVGSAPGADLDAAYVREWEALGAGASYRRWLGDAFVVSGLVDGDVVYVRVFDAGDGLRALRLRYPADLKPALDPVTTRASLTFGPVRGGAPLPDPGTVAPDTAAPGSDAAPPPAPAPPADAAPEPAPEPAPADLAAFVGDWRGVADLAGGWTDVRLRVRAGGSEREGGGDALEVVVETRGPDEAAFAPRGRVTDVVPAGDSVTWVWSRGDGTEVQGVVPAEGWLFVTFEGAGVVAFERER